MAIRKIVLIDEEKCDGCGLCVPSCAEGAIKVIDGKAKLLDEIFCDGLGACLGNCPLDAITMEERDAEDFDEAAVEVHLAKTKAAAAPSPAPAACPSSAARQFQPQQAGQGCPGSAMQQLSGQQKAGNTDSQPADSSQLGHWPVQLMLIPPHAPFLQGADLIICADCVPFAVPDFHQRYLTGTAVVIGCPKLDDLDHYEEKLKAILATASPASVTVLRMEVPCCGGIAQATVQARNAAAPNVPIEVHTVGIRGGIHHELVPGEQSA